MRGRSALSHSQRRWVKDTGKWFYVQAQIQFRFSN